MTARTAANRGLYAISQATPDDGALLAWADAVIAGGAIWLQYRDKSDDTLRRRTQALALRERCRQAGVRFIVNDDVELAVAVAADGVHLGVDDGGVADARAVLGRERVIGVSCYDDFTRAQQMAAAGADYLAFGAFFASETKPGARKAGPDLLHDARTLDRPLVAIGGITPDNGAQLVRAGADLLAVVGGLAGDPVQAHAAARRYTALFDNIPESSYRP